MTITSTTQKVSVSGNGSATVFSFSPVVIFEASDLVVIKRDADGVETTLTEGTGSTNYSLGFSTFPATGSITYPAAGTGRLASGETLTIKRVVPLTQEVDLENQGGYFPEVQETVYDRLTGMAQQLQEQINRTLRTAESDATIVGELPTVEDRANQLLGFDGDGEPIAAQPSSATVSSVMQDVVSASTLLAAAAKMNVGAPYNVQHYGAIGDGSTDDTTAIANAVAAAIIAKRALYFPGTTTFYKIASAITIDGPLTILGDGMANSTIKTTSGTAKIFNIAGSNVTIQDMGFAATVTRTAGAFIETTASIGTFKVKGCFFSGHFRGITLTAAISVVDISDCYFFDCTTGTGVGILVDNGFDVSIRNCIMNSSASPQPLAGVEVRNCGDIVMEDLNIIQHKQSILINPAAGQEVDSIYATDCFFDTSSDYGLLVLPSSTGVVQRCRFIGCWFSSHGIDGARISASGVSATVDGIEFINCHAFANTGDGFKFAYGTNFSVIGCSAAGNTAAGVSVSAAITDFTINGCVLGTYAGFAANLFGIFIAVGASDNYIITGNRLRGNGTNLGDGGTGLNKEVSGNLTA